MALTKAKLISDGVITTDNLADNSVTAAKLNNITTDDISEGTNKFAAQSDLDKLAGIEALADVTDAANVAAAGALMSGTAALSDLVDVSSASPTDGQVLTYDTTNGWQPEDSQGSEYTISEISTNTTAQKEFIYVLTASLTLTLPASPSVGDKLAVVNTSGTTTPVIARNGSLIMGAAEDFTIDVNNVAVELIYTGATKGWVIIADSIYGSEATPSSASSIDGSGTANYVTKWSDADTLADSIIYDTGTNIGIGTSSPNYRLTVAGNTSANTIAAINNTSNVSRFSFAENAAPSSTYTNIEGDARASGYLAFRTNDTERARVTSDGDVGIGTSSPAPASGRALTVYNATRANLVVNTNGNKAELFVDGSDFYLDHYPAGNIVFRNSTRTERMRITSSGTLKLDSGGILQFASNTSTPAYGVAIHRPDVDTLAFVTNSGERMRVGGDGRLLVGCTSTPSSTVSGTRISDPIQAACTFSAGSVTTSVTQLGFINGNGVVGTIRTNGSSTLYNTSSDYRLKENILPISSALDRVSQLKPSRFNFIADPTKIVDGFLAHEVQDIVPEAVSGEKDAVDKYGNPEYQGIDQSKLVPLLTAAIQELKAEIDQLKTQINS